MKKKCCMFLSAALILSGLVFSRAGLTGSINGVVKTPEGAPFPGVIVLLRSPALIVPEVEAVSNQFGVYRFPGLSPGVYELSFIVRGLETYERKGIVVSAGKTVSLDVDLPLRASGEAVVVEGKAPVIDRLKIKGVTTLDKKFLVNDENIRNRYPLNADATAYVDDFIGSHELKIGRELQLGRTEWNYDPFINMDLRAETSFDIQRFTLKAFYHAFHIFNDNTVTWVRLFCFRTESDFCGLLQILPPRIFQLGARIEF
jgi:hypothetical protein